MRAHFARSAIRSAPSVARWMVRRSSQNGGQLLNHWLMRGELPALFPDGLPAVIDGVSLHVHADRWAFYHSGETRSRELFRTLCPREGVVLDIGANVGLYSLIAAQTMHDGAIHAVEPSPYNLRLLKRNVVQSPFIQVHETAAGDVSGTVPFQLTDGLNDAITLNAYGQKLKRGTVSVQISRLDDLIEGPIDLLKIDVQGHEPAAFAGMSRLLAQTRVLMMEWAPSSLIAAGHDPISVPDLLAQHGFRMETMLDDSGEPGELPHVLRYIDGHPTSLRYWDVIARR
jgi:FkbM family methyltransferase